MNGKTMKRYRDLKITKWILSRFIDPAMCSSILEDLAYRCEQETMEKGRMTAFFSHVIRCLIIIIPLLLEIVLGGLSIFQNYFKITLRNIRRHKIFSLLNIAGLSIGIACCIIVLLYVTHELSYDQFHEKKDFIYRVTTQKNVRDTWYFSPDAPWSAGQVLKERFPEVKDYTIYSVSLTDCIIEKEGELYRTREERIVNASFFNIFTFPFLHGDPNTALNDPSSIVVTESFARRWFGTTEALGKILNIRGGDRIVTGVLKDIPHNSHLQFGFLAPVSWHLNHETWWREMLDNNWGGYGVATYLLMNQRISLHEFTGKIRNIVQEYDAEQSKRLSIQPLDKVYLYSNMLMEEHEAEESSDRIVGSIHNLRALIVAATVLLIIACVNFMNLSTAIVARRAKEIGVRKVCGSQREDLVRQFLGESLSLAFFSTIVALFLVAVFLPTFNQYSGKQLLLQSLFDVKIIMGILGITILTGILSGCYPAFYLSSLKSVDVFKKTILPSRKRKTSLRQVLVVFQFALAVTVIICTIVFGRQFYFIQNKFKSFDLDNTIVVIDRTFARHHDVVKKDLLQHPHIISVTQSAMPGASLSPSSDISWPGKDPGNERVFFHGRVDHDYLDVMHPQVVEGRFFSREIASDTLHFLVNETAVRVMGMTSPIGQRISYKGRDGMIIGVLKDRHFASLRYPIHPFVFEINPDYPRFNIKVDGSENIPIALKHINNVRRKYPNYRPVSYWFAEDQLSHYMKEEHTLSHVFSYVAFLTIIIACLGLFGLSLFHAVQKTKEIGIRKVLGCSATRIAVLLTQAFVKWVLLANVIAWPVAYVLMKHWLHNYVYRINIGVMTFIVSSGAAMIVALFTVGYQSMKAATANPVDSLRYE
jgi:putative ABC transport system permease protein